MIRLVRLLAVALAALGFASAAQAQLAFDLRTGTGTQQWVPIDSNNCANAGPRAMYVGGVVTNNGAATATNVVATLSGLGSGFFLAGGQPAAQAVGALGPGQSTGVYWFVGYGCTDGAAASPTISIVSSAGTTSRILTLTARSAISANAGGSVTGSLLGPGAVVGQTIWFDATYSFGNGAVDDEYYLQPSGGQAFDAACFRLVASQVRSSNVTAIPAGAQNRLYFVGSSKQSGSGFTATVRYYFEYQCAGASTSSRPYAVQTSGSSNIKYTGNFDGSGSVSIAFPGATNPFLIAKTSDLATGIAGAQSVVKYTVTVTNPSLHASRISQFVDTLPAGASFVALDAASDVTAANSSSVPVAGATGTLVFFGRQDQSYLIAPGGTVRLIYTVRMPAAAGTYVNSASARFGTASTPTASAAFAVVVPTPLTAVKSSQPTSDPVNGTANPKAIPGARVAYTIAIANPGSFAVTSDSVAIVDATPARMKLVVASLASGPVLFQDGAVASGLTYSFAGLASTADDVDFSNDGGATWNYVPTADPAGADAAVTHIRIRPKGVMAAASGFTLRLAYAID